MRSKMFLMLGISLILLGGAAMAQDNAPKAEFFGGYSYMRTAGHTNINGWNVQAAMNVKKWFGIAADFSGHYQTESMDGTRPSASITSFMFGPQIYDRAGRVTGFAHALFGGARTTEGLEFGKGEVPATATNFGMAFGGGIDAKVSNVISVRLFQADFLMVRAANPFSGGTENRNNFRLSIGVVFGVK